jgi:antitoxin MazE
MKARIIQIGNSRGIRIPGPVLDQCGLTDEIDLEVSGQKLIIRPSGTARKGWESAFEQMAVAGDDQLPDRVAESPTEWDRKEWEW